MRDYDEVIALWRLCDKALSRLRQIGIQKCHLFVFASNSHGRRFWKANGWIARRDLAVMSKALTP